MRFLTPTTQFIKHSISSTDTKLFIMYDFNPLTPEASTRMAQLRAEDTALSNLVPIFDNNINQLAAELEKHKQNTSFDIHGSTDEHQTKTNEL